MSVSLSDINRVYLNNNVCTLSFMSLICLHDSDRVLPDWVVTRIEKLWSINSEPVINEQTPDEDDHDAKPFRIEKLNLGTVIPRDIISPLSRQIAPGCLL